MAGSLALHPFGFQYYVLRFFAGLLRFTARLGSGKLQKQFASLRSDVSRTRIEIPSREAGRTITVDMYEKVGQPKDTRRYAHINLHGSGYVIPSLGSDLDFCAQLAATGTVVLDADYRKAPEHPFPAAFQDAEDVLAYVQKQASDFDTKHLTIGGFSAGANLAMAVAVNAAPNTFAGVVSCYGNTDLSTSYPAPDDKNFDSGAVLPGWLRTFFYKCLVIPGQDKTDARLSPIFAPLDRWPEHVFLACGAADSLHDAAKVMAKKLQASGHADVEFLSVEREAHAFDKGVKAGSRTEERRTGMYQQALDMIERAHGGS